MFDLYFKHLFPYYEEWSETPFLPWGFSDCTFFSVLSFFECDLNKIEEQSISRIVKTKTFMDSGAFAAASLGIELDPYEIAEMHSILKADLIVPLDKIILQDDPENIVESKIKETIRNTEILLDYNIKRSEVVGPLQGLKPEILERMFLEYKDLGIRTFALGGLVFQESLSQSLERISSAREITESYYLHIFGRFLHPRLLRGIIETGVDSVDGFGYILRSIRGFYIYNGNYTSIGLLQQSQLEECECQACTNSSLDDFQRGDREAQHLLIKHNIEALIKIKDKIIRGGRSDEGIN
ncbi:MAG: tRNA-guanine transglycosylase [Candidatus Hodarchaeales archaeon]